MPKEKRLPSLEEALGYTFTKETHLTLALTHPSAAHGDGEENNQRLEFLGDAVLQLLISEALFSRFPSKDEGDLTQLRAALVREETLARAAKRIGLGGHLRFDHGEAQSGGRDKPSVLADALEAVLAAIYLDGGLEAARSVCARVMGDLSSASIPRNWKSLLQEREQAKGLQAPTYHVIGEEGPPHARVFTVEVWLGDKMSGRGQGGSKKQAEQEAARATLEEAEDH